MSKINTRAVQANFAPERQTTVSKLQIARALKAVRYHSKVCVLALLTSFASPPLTENSKADASIALASAHEKPASGDAEGAGIDFKEQLVAIEKEIQSTNQKFKSLKGLMF